MREEERGKDKDQLCGEKDQLLKEQRLLFRDKDRLYRDIDKIIKEGDALRPEREAFEEDSYELCRRLICCKTWSILPSRTLKFDNDLLLNNYPACACCWLI